MSLAFVVVSHPSKTCIGIDIPPLRKIARQGTLSHLATQSRKHLSQVVTIRITCLENWNVLIFDAFYFQRRATRATDAPGACVSSTTRRRSATLRRRRFDSGTTVPLAGTAPTTSVLELSVCGNSPPSARPEPNSLPRPWLARMVQVLG